MADSLADLLNRLPQQGRVEWIGLRPGREQPMQSVQRVTVDLAQGLVGDRFSGRPGSKRQVTLIQQEHLPVIAACLHQPSVAAELLRRNLLISGINLLALKDKEFEIGGVRLAYTGLCHPCSKMERLLGPGGYNAMRGHGGITASVIRPGEIQLGDAVYFSSDIAD